MLSLPHAPASSASSLRSPCLFTSDQHQLYQIRYTEGLDLPDPDYDAWLAIYHPETLSSSAANSLVTHVSGGLLDKKTVDNSSDALSEVLSKQKKKDKRERKHSVPAKRKSSKSENRGLSTSTPDLASIFSDKCNLLDWK